MTDISDNDMYLILGRLEGKLDSLMVVTEKQWDTIEKHDTRIKKLETDRHMVYGAAAVLGVIGSVVIWVISNFVRST
jgi:hypothetical protein|tara:strand:+ start:3714 stop:3944 length:231 start_codon:yes stop_codon:yes gene_type:complete